MARVNISELYPINETEELTYKELASVVGGLLPIDLSAIVPSGIVPIELQQTVDGLLTTLPPRTVLVLPTTPV